MISSVAERAVLRDLEEIAVTGTDVGRPAREPGKPPPCEEAIDANPWVIHSATG